MNFEMISDHTDESQVDLTADNRTVAETCCREVCSALKFLYESLPNLKISTRYNVLSVARANLDRLNKATGHDASQGREIDLCNKKLREANQAIRDLHAQLANATPLDGLGDLLYKLDQEVTAQWKSLGFSLVDGSFEARWSSNQRYIVKLSFYLSPDHDEDCPVTSKNSYQEKMSRLQEEADFVFVHGDWRFLDTPKNRAWVLARMREKYPSFVVHEWESRMFARELPDSYYLASAKAAIDLDNLGHD